MIDVIPSWHLVFVYVTVVLLSLAVILHLAERFVRSGSLRCQWEMLAQWSLWLGATITLLTMTMGFVAYNSMAHDTPLHGAMNEHRNWALLTTSLLVGLAGWSALRARAGRGTNTAILLGLLLGGGLWLGIVWHGSEAAYRFGLGTMSQPKTDSHKLNAATTD